MATYHMKVKNVSKHKQSAVAKAAYTTGDKLYSERDEENKSYRKREVAPDSFILAPEHAPDFVYDREKLWNEAEKVEKNYNSRVMREIVVALPVELSDEQQRELVKKFATDVLVSDGMVTDISIHRDKEHNPHAHILCTVRTFEENGEWSKSKSKKEYLLDESGNRIVNDKGNFKTRNVDLKGWSKPETIIHWREKYADYINEFYKNNGLNIKVSHQSNEARGIEELPQQRLTREEYYIEELAKNKAIQDGIEYYPVTYYGKLNKEIEEYNKELNIIQSQINKLENFKSNDNVIDLNEYKEIRNRLLSDNQEVVDSLQSVAKRMKVSLNEIDYLTVKENQRSLQNWKRLIDKKFIHLNVEKKTLETALKHYKSNSNELIKLGFSKNNFVKEYNARAVILDDKYKKLSNEFKGYKETFELSKSAIKFEKNVLSNQFAYVYPEYKNFTSFDYDNVYETMRVSLHELNSGNRMTLQKIDDFELKNSIDLNDEFKFIDDIEISIRDYKTESKEYFSLNKKVQLVEETYKEVITKYKDISEKTDAQKEEIYNAALNVLTTKGESSSLNSKYETTRSNILNQLIEIYGEHQSDVIQKVPDRYKVKLLEEYLKDQHSNNLHDDLEKLNWITQEKFKESKNIGSNDWKDWSENNPNNETQNGEIAQLQIGNLLSDLIAEAQKNNDNSDDTSRSLRERRKRGLKLTKEEKLELE